MAMGELEKAVMAELWAADAPRTVREVHASLSSQRSLAYTTVMTVLGRLAKKGVVHQERHGRAYRYSPVRNREEMTAELMLDAMRTSSDLGNREAALQHFVGQVSPREAEVIRAALSRAPADPHS
ncbi:BlaI/MecI/CopY family transcriptional regulator [Ornithinimicrobium sufpigmenti]|uniref:BlaI/MecI/CopY family transcriptional regulator n=1 Tax=Ornithinimicrobium sufpigmenti TaxID=2508882 RepID=UPI0010361E02|nr:MULTISPECIES: BlaI/MecI/CopY family transcriptional regulator [unclassified Ornithinimicrobium]